MTRLIGIIFLIQKAIIVNSEAMTKFRKITVNIFYSLFENDFH